MRLEELKDFNFDLPEELIRKFPSSNRSESRLLVVNRKQPDKIINSTFQNLIQFLKPTDVLVRNITKVSKMRVKLFSEKGRIYDVLFLENVENYWKCLVKNLKKIKLQEILTTNSEGSYQFRVVEKAEEFCVLKPLFDLTEDYFQNYGNIPIPPYFKREANSVDEERYQTVYCKNSSEFDESFVGTSTNLEKAKYIQTVSVAAPTAGLHFTDKLLSELNEYGVEILDLELKVGYGTFQKLKESNFLEKKIHTEYFSLSKVVANQLTEHRKNGRRIISVGTTTLRALESSYDPTDKMYYFNENGQTNLFITPEEPIHSIDGLITNFHVPESSLLLLVSAFFGKKNLLDVYIHAIKEKYHFFSYGDAMLIT